MAKINYAHQIASLVCQRYFTKIGFELPPKFWSDVRFARDYRLQIIRANSLLKLYSGPAILAALNSAQGNWIWSLTNKKLNAIIAIEQKRLEKEERRLQKAIEQYAKATPQVVENKEVVKSCPITEAPKTLFEKLE